MFSDIDPMVITLVIVAVAVVGSIIGVARRGRTEPAADRTSLPVGADAALWSITEVLPDPRNHLAIKDPTSELRLTARERAEAADEARAAAATVRPADAARTAQSIAARRAALAKRAPATPAAPAGPAAAADEPLAVEPVAPASGGGEPAVAHVVEAAPSSIELVHPVLPDEPLTIFLEDPAGDPRHLTLLPEDLRVAPDAPLDPGAPRWGEAPARAS